MTYKPTTEEVRSMYGGPRYEPEFDLWLADHDAEVRAQALAPIRAALAGHPRCDIHPDGDPITCGWKRAVASVQAALDHADQIERGE